MMAELGWCDSQVPFECCAEGEGVVVADAAGDMRDGGVRCLQEVTREGKAPTSEVGHGWLADACSEARGERSP